MIFGWDISTSIIGATVLTDGGVFVRSTYLDLRKFEIDLIDKCHRAEGFVDDILASHGQANSVHYIEDRLGSFAGGRTMQQTLLKLAAFNASVSYVIWRQFHMAGVFTTVEHIHPSTVKGIMRKRGLVVPKGGDKKMLTLEWVSNQESSFPVTLNKNGKPQPYCFDMADSFIVAYAGYLRSCNKTEK